MAFRSAGHARAVLRRFVADLALRLAGRRNAGPHSEDDRFCDARIWLGEPRAGALELRLRTLIKAFYRGRVARTAADQRSASASIPHRTRSASAAASDLRACRGVVYATARPVTSGANLHQSQRFEIAYNYDRACGPILSRVPLCAGPIKAKPFGWPRKTRPALTGPAHSGWQNWRSGRENARGAGRTKELPRCDSNFKTLGFGQNQTVADTCSWAPTTRRAAGLCSIVCATAARRPNR